MASCSIFLLLVVLLLSSFSFTEPQHQTLPTYPKLAWLKIRDTRFLRRWCQSACDDRRYRSCCYRYRCYIVSSLFIIVVIFQLDKVVIIIYFIAVPVPVRVLVVVAVTRSIKSCTLPRHFHRTLLILLPFSTFVIFLAEQPKSETRNGNRGEHPRPPSQSVSHENNKIKSCVFCKLNIPPPKNGFVLIENRDCTQHSKKWNGTMNIYISSYLNKSYLNDR